jgi:hypothetical protein
MREYEKFHLPQAVGLSSPHLGSKQSVLSMLGQGIDLEKEPNKKNYMKRHICSHKPTVTCATLRGYHSVCTLLAIA